MHVHVHSKPLPRDVCPSRLNKNACFCSAVGKAAAVCRVLSYEHNSTGKRSFIVTTYSKFWQRYQEVLPDHRHHYEIIQEQTPCHLYFGKASCLPVDARLWSLQGLPSTMPHGMALTVFYSSTLACCQPPTFILLLRKVMFGLSMLLVSRDSSNDAFL